MEMKNNNRLKAKLTALTKGAVCCHCREVVVQFKLMGNQKITKETSERIISIKKSIWAIVCCYFPPIRHLKKLLIWRVLLHSLRWMNLFRKHPNWSLVFSSPSAGIPHSINLNWSSSVSPCSRVSDRYVSTGVGGWARGYPAAAGSPDCSL